jgi:hypothetical protein
MHLRPRMGLRLELFGMRHFCPRRRRTASSRIIVERFLSEAVGVVTRRYYQYGGLVTLLPCPRPSDQRTVWCNSGWILCCLFHLVLLLDDNSAEHCKSCCHVCVLLLENTLLARGGAVSLECREACFILRNHHQILCSRTFDFMA